MEYLQPIKTLEGKVSLYKSLLVGCAAFLLISIVVTPMMMTTGNAFILRKDDSISLAEKEPWRASVTRIESFRDFYLRSRFEWNEGNFESKKEAVRAITTENVANRLKDSFSAFDGLIKSQKARGYYAFEEFGFSNEKHQVEARVIRVLKIGKVAVATPLIVRFEYRDVGFTPANPYGLQITSLSESEVN